jgi:hypothetical protein
LRGIWEKNSDDCKGFFEDNTRKKLEPKDLTTAFEENTLNNPEPDILVNSRISS